MYRRLNCPPHPPQQGTLERSRWPAILVREPLVDIRPSNSSFSGDGGVRRGPPLAPPALHWCRRVSQGPSLFFHPATHPRYCATSRPVHFCVAAQPPRAASSPTVSAREVPAPLAPPPRLRKAIPCPHMRVNGRVPLRVAEHVGRQPRRSNRRGWVRHLPGLQTCRRATEKAGGPIHAGGWGRRGAPTGHMHAGGPT